MAYKITPGTLLFHQSQTIVAIVIAIEVYQKNVMKVLMTTSKYAHADNVEITDVNTTTYDLEENSPWRSNGWNAMDETGIVRWNERRK